ncbi:MAG TPA: SgcJ/EcaC family oxidoreductase [Puia sp.]|uniref:YybH family protein n=1 Tax=Puia sp. TaxID=2045100 RepID=UPI002C6A53B2|nr:SgcJ/EcaC family oxidoreductase [Puia sp.]HVU97188.1 SgcJ/EcaC family oxidoreductase [Puia sp.]
MQELQSLFDRYKQSVYQKDTESFLTLFDDDVRVFDMWAWTYDGLAAWRQMVTGWFAGLGADRDVVTFDDIRIQQSGDMAVASAIARFAAVSEKGEELRFLQNRLTWVVRKKNGFWKIIHEHSSGPVDGSTMKVQLQR